jgi:hypothetical protein
VFYFVDSFIEWEDELLTLFIYPNNTFIKLVIDASKKLFFSFFLDFLLNAKINYIKISSSIPNNAFIKVGQ